LRIKRIFVSTYTLTIVYSRTCWCSVQSRGSFLIGRLLVKQGPPSRCTERLPTLVDDGQALTAALDHRPGTASRAHRATPNTAQTYDSIRNLDRKKHAKYTAQHAISSSPLQVRGHHIARPVDSMLPSSTSHQYSLTRTPGRLLHPINPITPLPPHAALRHASSLHPRPNNPSLDTPYPHTQHSQYSLVGARVLPLALTRTTSVSTMDSSSGISEWRAQSGDGQALEAAGREGRGG